MNFRQLRFFSAVADELHFGRAAQRLGITQPPLSVAIKGLESALGVRLLDRTTRSVRLTPAGVTLRDEARRLLADLDRAASLVRRVGQGIEGTLSIGFVGVANLLGLPDLVRAFHQAAPKVNLELDERPTDALVDGVRTGRLDLAFLRVLDAPPPDLDQRPFVKEGYALAMPADADLAQSETLSLADLDDAPLLFFPRRFHPQIHDAWLAAFHRAGVVPRLVQEARTVQTEMALVKAGLGMALVTRSAAKTPQGGVVYRPLSGDMPAVDVRVVWRRENHTPLVSRFIRLLDGADDPRRQGA